MSGPRVLIAVVSAFLLAAACSSGDVPEGPQPPPDVPASSASPTPSVQQGEASADAELTVSQNGQGCGHPLFVRGVSLPGDARLQLRWAGSESLDTEVITNATGSFHLWIDDAFPPDCGPASAYQLSVTEPDGGTLASVDVRMPDTFSTRLTITPPAGGCGEIVIGVGGMRPNWPVVVHARPYNAIDSAASTVIVSMVANRSGSATSDLLATAWTCDSGPLQISASVEGGPPSRPWATRPHIVDVNEFDPIPGLRVHPLATRTGVAEVDRALELVITGDVEGLAVLAVVAPQPCVRESGVFGVPCPDGADAATAVEVFAYGTCSGDFVYPEQLRAPFVRFLGLTTGNQTVALPLRIHSIEQIIPTPAVDEAAYVLHFAFADGSARHLPLRADGRIPTISLGCFDPDPIERHATTEHEWLLPPQT